MYILGKLEKGMFGEKDYRVICPKCKNIITDRDSLLEKYDSLPSATSYLEALTHGTDMYKCDKCKHVSSIGFVWHERRKKFNNSIRFLKNLPIYSYRIIIGLSGYLLNKIFKK